MSSHPRAMGKAQDVQGRARGCASSLQILARGAQYATSLEDAKVIVGELVDIVEFVWPTKCLQEHTAVSASKAVIPGSQTGGGGAAEDA